MHPLTQTEFKSFLDAIDTSCPLHEASSLAARGLAVALGIATARSTAGYPYQEVALYVGVEKANGTGATWRKVYAVPDTRHTKGCRYLATKRSELRYRFDLPTLDIKHGSTVVTPRNSVLLREYEAAKPRTVPLPIVISAEDQRFDDRFGF